MLIVQQSRAGYNAELFRERSDREAHVNDLLAETDAAAGLVDADPHPQPGTGRHVGECLAGDGQGKGGGCRDIGGGRGDGGIDSRAVRFHVEHGDRENGA